MAIETNYILTEQEKLAAFRHIVTEVAAYGDCTCSPIDFPCEFCISVALSNNGEKMTSEQDAALRSFLGKVGLLVKPEAESNPD